MAEKEAMTSKEKEKSLIEDITRMRYLEERMKTAQTQILSIDRMLVEISVSLSSLEEIKDLKEDKESLFPLGGGIMANGILKKNDTVLVDVGAGATVEKTVKEAIELLKEREKGLRKNMVDLQNMMANIEEAYIGASQRAQELRGGV